MKYENIFSKDSLTRVELAKAVSTLAKKHNNFLLDVPPRVGKSILAIELLKKWDFDKLLILSGANSTNAQWIENIEKYNPQLLSKVDVYCYQSLHKIPRDIYDVIFLDEFDIATTDNRLSNLYEFSPKHWIAMSGTLYPEDIDMFRDLVQNKFFRVTVTFEQAVDWGILPQPIIFKVALRMDNSNRYLLYHKGKDKNKKNNIVDYPDRWSAFKDKKRNAIIKCTEKEYHELICAEFDRWKRFESEFDLPAHERSDDVTFLQSKGFTKSVCRDKKMRIGNERKQFFANIKNRHFKTLFNQLPDNSRVLVFCNDTKQADLLNKEFAVHSKNPDSLELVEQFNNKQIDKLFSIKMLERGVDFVDVDYLVILQSSMKQGGQIQKFARSGLSLSPKTILFYYPGTQDELYVEEFLKNFRPEWIIQKRL